MHPYHEIKMRQLAAVRQTRRLEGAPARDEKERSRLFFTRLGLLQGIALFVAVGLVTGDWGGSHALILPSTVMGGIVIDALRSA